MNLQKLRSTLQVCVSAKYVELKNVGSSVKSGFLCQIKLKGDEITDPSHFHQHFHQYVHTLV